MAQITRKERGPDFVASFNGNCRLCPEPIVEGVDFVCRVDGVKGTFHTHCAQRYLRTLEEHLPDEGEDRDE